MSRAVQNSVNTFGRELSHTVNKTFAERDGLTTSDCIEAWIVSAPLPITWAPRLNAICAGSKLQRYIAAHAVANHHRLYQGKFGAQPREVVRKKGGHRVVLMRRVALAMSTKIDRCDAMRAAEEVCLWCKTV